MTDILNALQGTMQLESLAIFAIGTVVGIVIGIIPGLGTVMAVALLIPFTFGMEPEIGIGLLVAVFVGGVSGGCVTAILLRMPGTPSSVATVLDGFPLAQQGRGGEAIGNAVVASFIGTVMSTIALIIFAPLLADFALRFYFPEYVAVSLFALTAISAVSGPYLLRGMLAAMLGLLCSTFGISEADALPRFDFGIDAMQTGFGFVPAIMGLFAISQMMKLAGETSVAPEAGSAEFRAGLPTVRDIMGNATNYLRSGLIGTIIGVVPAVGAATAGLISYAQAKSWSKTPDKFGTGHVPGIIASETANNAVIGGALIIALTLGIPGDPTTAVLLGGLMIHGIAPGAQLFQNHPEVVYAIYFTMLFSSVVMALTLIVFMRPLARAALLPKHILIPCVSAIAIIGVYSINSNPFDLYVMLGFAFLGFVMERLQYPLPPLVLGLVLGPLIEGNFRKMIGQFGDLMPLVQRPIALTFIILTLLTIAFVLMRRMRRISK
ncbi:MAG: tripartite tricarboxylate transporter permease [Hyphomicrobiales bacterium]